MKLYIIILLVLFITNPIYSQETKPFYIGITASPTMIWLKSETKEIDKTLFDGLGFNYGLFADIRIVYPDDYLSIGILRYHTVSSLAYNTDTIYHHGYIVQSIDIPVGYKCKFLDNSVPKEVLYVFLGITTSFVQKAEANLKPDFDKVNKEGIDFKNNITFFNISVNLELGIERALIYNTSLLVELYYHWGLNNYIDDPFERGIFPRHLGLRTGIVF